MKIEKLPSGSYRVRKTVNKKVYSMVFDSKPKDKEIFERLSELISESDAANERGSFKEYAEKYVSNRSNVLSPSSVLTYERLIKGMSDGFKRIKIDKITQTDVQSEINRYAENHAPKTVRSMHGFIAAVLGEFRPKLMLRTTLPQKVESDRYLPTTEDIKKIYISTTK